MNDLELERTLRRYRVGGPPVSLAARIVAPRTSRARDHVRGAVAAAAIVAMWIAAHAAAKDSVHDPVRQRHVMAITAALGGGEDMQQYAEEIVPRWETKRPLELPPEMSW